MVPLKTGAPPKDVVTNKQRKTIAFFGEVMVEIAGQPLELNFGGDVFNTAIYLMRLGRRHSDEGPLLRVDLVSAVGDDSFSADLLAMCEQEGIDTSWVEWVADKTLGLYLVETSSAGERSFHYWRECSAIRSYVELYFNRLRDYLANNSPDYFYFSGTSLAILSKVEREQLLDLVAQFRQYGGLVVFDNNFRSSLWPSPQEAKSAFLRVLGLADIAFLTDEDEEMVFGSSEPGLIISRCEALGVSEIVVKRGDKPCVISFCSEIIEVEVPKVQTVVDSCAAGDSFAAGYLFERLSGNSIYAAAIAGHRIASKVIQHRGAIIPEEILWS